jgi:putative FmdB family regulatory protein
MPTYDYRCNACEHEFEIFQSMKDRPKKKCPECGKNALERLIGMGAGVIFKGGGFYETDYRSESYKKAAEADKPKADKADAGGGCACGQKTAKECASTKSPATSKKAAKSAS